MQFLEDLIKGQEAIAENKKLMLKAKTLNHQFSIESTSIHEFGAQ